MSSTAYRIAKVEKSLRWFEQDIPLLDMRVKDLSKEHQESAKQFAAAVVDKTRAELQRLLQEQPGEPDSVTLSVRRTRARKNKN